MGKRCSGLTNEPSERAFLPGGLGQAKGSQLNIGSYPILAKLDGIEINEIDAKPGG
jgi:hypothetical protein